ncbi:MAG: Trk system potassium transporter TrkA [Bacteroidaceae bacterium]|nr:Trk system potassium transporter TrkA [Bacteroidaceae bacterium]
MKIIIAGAGAVGSHLATLLTRENHDIIILDANAEKLANATEGLDLMTLAVSPTSIRGLKEAGVPQADLFIAVTPSETTNMTCCMLAHSLGAKKTVARIDNSEYLQPHNSQFFHNMGIGSLIYPEVLAAQEIIDGVKRSWVRQWCEVHGGSLITLGIKLREEASQLFGKPLKDLCPPDSPFHIVAIKRDEDTIIPGGFDILKLGDIAYFMTARRYVQNIRQLVGKENYPDVKKIMIMGGGRIAVQTCHMLPDYMQAKIIEQDINRCQQLVELLDNDDVMIINGDGRDTKLLLDEGIRQTQAFCALTPETETNILACLAAKRMGVRKTVALVENQDYITMAEKLDIGTIINKKAISASHIYQMMLDADVASVKSLTITDAEVAEFVAAEGSIVTQKPVMKLGLPSDVAIGGIVRPDGEAFLVNGRTQIQPHDRVVIFTRSNQLQYMERYFQKPKQGLLNALGIGS